MHRKTRIWLGMLAVAAVVATAGSAPAKNLMGMFQDNDLSVPNGTHYTTCTGVPIWGAAYGYDNTGAVVCGPRLMTSGYWFTSNSGCPSSAVKYRASLQVTGGTLDPFCMKMSDSWPGPIVACQVNLMTLKQGTGACVNRSFSVFALGY